MCLRWGGAAELSRLAEQARRAAKAAQKPTQVPQEVSTFDRSRKDRAYRGELVQAFARLHRANSACYRVTDSHKGPEIWEVRWHTCWRKSHNGKLISSQCTLIVAKNVRTGEFKYFLSNRVPGRGGWTLRAILRVAFSRWKVEACFREVKEELGWDHFECRGWGCVHRHLIVTILSQLFCARVRHQQCPSEVVTDAKRLTLEQVRRAMDVYLDAVDLPRAARLPRYEAELKRIRYHQARNATASRSHFKTRREQYEAMGIDPTKIKSVHPKSP